MKRLVNTLFLVVPVLMIAAGPALAQQASSFQQSCENIFYTTDSAGTPAIEATCKNGDGSESITSKVAIRGIHNMEGRLSAGAGVSTFQQSCEGMRIAVDGQHVKLYATCQKSDGSSVETSATIWDILNDNGRLRNRVPGNDQLVD